MTDTQTTQQEVTFTVDGQEVKAPQGSSLLEALNDNGFNIPHLCHHWAVEPYGACRLCLVEVKKGRKTKLTTSCNYPVLEGIEVTTKNERIQKNRTMMMELILSRAPESKEMQTLAKEQFGITKDQIRFDKDNSNDNCILCGLCVRVCRDVVGVEALSFANRGTEKAAVPPYNDIAKSCIGCGACVYVCPTNCIGFEQLPTQRELDRWHRKLPMRTCTQCGYPFAPVFQLMHFKKHSSTPEEFFEICADCRKMPSVG